MKRLFAVLALLGMAIASNAQNEVDALRYSQTNLYGTARSMSMGGAFGALGADFSVLSTNPAGIALYKSSEFTITPSLYFSNIEATYKYNNHKMDDTDDNFNISNFGVVLAQDLTGRRNNNKWKYIQFGVGLNRLNNFNKNIIIDGVNNENSYTDVLAALANGKEYYVIADDEYGDFAFDLNPAWNTWLIDTIPGNYSQYKSTAPAGAINQRKVIDEWGSMSEIMMAFGANYNDFLYIGGSIGFPMIRYSMSSKYTETNMNDSTIVDGSFREFRLREELDTKGTGINLKFGFIVRPTNWLRIGGAVHTPTWFMNITDEWSNIFYSKFDLPKDTEGNREFDDPSPLGSYEYDLRTPMKALGSIGFIIGKSGLISAEYEYINYSTAKLSAADYDFITDNENIEKKYTAAHNIKLGTEWRLSNFSLRGGFALYGSPYKDDLNDGVRKFYSAGLGYRQNSYFIDLAWVYKVSEEDYYLYGLDDVKVNPTLLHEENHNFMLTFGYRF